LDVHGSRRTGPRVRSAPRRRRPALGRTHRGDRLPRALRTQADGRRRSPVPESRRSAGPRRPRLNQLGPGRLIFKDADREELVEFLKWVTLGARALACEAIRVGPDLHVTGRPRDIAFLHSYAVKIAPGLR